MLWERIAFRYFCRKINKIRLKSARIPDDIERKTDIPYGIHGKWNLLDVYYPRTISSQKPNKPLPTIINIHGGGYVYGTKNEYQYYCMLLAQHGFTVVNFSYRLAPKAKFPIPVNETNEVMQWVCSNADAYCIDLDNIFIAGDSAGAQIASQYSAIVTNPEYAALFGLNIPHFKLRAIVLNCGVYAPFSEIKPPLLGLVSNYFGRDFRIHGEKVNIIKYINKNFPPSFIMSSANDPLLPYARPMFEYLQEKGIDCVCKIYGTPEQKEIGHVFHLDIRGTVARECNDEECEWLREFVEN